MANRVEIILEAKDRVSKVFASVQSKVTKLNATIAGTGAASAGMDKAAVSANRLGVASKGAALGVTALTRALAPLLAIGSLIKVGQIIGRFEEQMDAVAAVTGATNDEMAELTETAKELGATTRYSASEAASGMEFLGRAGFEANEIVAAMPGVLDLAAAGQLGLAEAADIASNVLSGFAESADQSNRVADILAKTAASSNTSVSQLGQAMSFVAPVSAELGLSIEETAAAIGVLSNAGIQSTRAGTGLSKVMADLTSLSDSQKEIFKATGAELDKLNPATNDLETVMRELNKAALSTEEAFEIFGSRGAVAALVLGKGADAAEGMESELQGLINANNGAGGTAKEMAELMSDNIPGAFRTMISAVESLILNMGEGGLGGVIRDIIDGFTVFIRGITGANKNAKDATSTMGQLGRSLKIVWDTMSDVYEVIGNIFGLLGEGAGDINIIALAFNMVALAVAGVYDLITVLIAGFVQLGGIIINTLLTPVGVFVKALGKAVGLVNGELGQSMQAMGQRIDDIGNNAIQAGKDMVKGFGEGGSAVERTLKRISGEDYEVEGLLDPIKIRTEAERVADALQKEVDGMVEATAVAGADMGTNLATGFKILKDEVERAVKELDYQLKEGTISIEDYYRKRLALQQSVIDKEIEKLTYEKSISEEANKQAELAGDILILQAKRRDLSVQSARDMADAEEKLAQGLQDVAIKLSRLTGQPVDLGDLETQISRRYDSLLKGLEAQGDAAGVAMVEKLISVEAAKSRFQELERTAGVSLGSVAALQDRLTKQTELGLISEREARTQLQQAISDQGSAIEAVIPEMEELARITGDPRMLENVEALKLELLTLGNTTDVVGTQINSALGDNMSSLLEDLSDGVGSAKDAFRSFADGVLDSFRKILSDQITKQLMQMLASMVGNSGGGAGGIGGLISSFFAAAATGGHIRGRGDVQRFDRGGKVFGPGSETSDSIPALLSKNEFVQKAAAVRHYGADFMHLLNQMKIPKAALMQLIAPGSRRMAYATGGHVGYSMPRISAPVVKVQRFAEGGIAMQDTTPASSEESAAQPIKILNVMDSSLVSDYMNSPSGEKIILNVMQKNQSRRG